MNELTVFSKDVIPVYTTDTGERVVVGRELHERLNISEKYPDWFSRMCEYGFVEDEDYSGFSEKSDKPQGGRPSVNHILKLEMAKHIAMIQRTPEGKAIRDKLIALETNVSELSPELRLLINLELKQKQHEAALEAVNKRVDNIGEVISLDTNSWRADSHRLIVGIAKAMGGNSYIIDVNKEIYRLVDQRAAVSLEVRLTNKRRRMADEGVCKSKRDKMNKLDVIADDKKLIEIYMAIVKEMAVKHGVTLETPKSA